MTVANINVRQVLLKRGNTAVSSAYVGPLGEVTVDTDLNTIRVHNGVLPGGSILPDAATVANIANINYFITTIGALSSNVANLQVTDSNIIANVSLLQTSTTILQSNVGVLAANVISIEAIAANLSVVATSGNYTDLTQLPQMVNSINVGGGLTQVNTFGNVTIDSTGVRSVLGSANQILVTDSGSKNLTLSLPQSIATSSTLTFANLTVTGNLNVIGTTTTGSVATVADKIMYLANAATTGTQIGGGGIVLGTGSSARSITYDYVNNQWDTDGAGLKTLEVNAGNIVVASLTTVDGAHFGAAYAGYNFPHAIIQIDDNVNAYSQHVQKNHSNGTDASTDFVAVNNLGDDTGYYIDMGINSSNYADPSYSISGPNSGYLYVDGGNLVIGTKTPLMEVVFHTGGALTTHERARITDGGFRTNYPLTSSVVTGTAPLTVASSTRVANLNVASSGQTDQLATARNINGVPFNGTSDITITSAADTLTGTTLHSDVVNSNLTSVGTLANLTVTFPIVGSITNGVVTSGTYLNPIWIASLSGTKISGYVPNATTANVAVLATNATNAARATLADTVTNGVTTTDTGSVTNVMLAGSITNNKLLTSNVTIVAGYGLSGGGAVTLGNALTLTNTGITSTVGTANQITALTTGGNVTLGLPLTVTMPGNLVLAAGTSINTALRLTSGALLTTPLNGAVEYDSKVVYLTPSDSERGVILSPQVFILAADRVGLNQIAAQSIFGVGVSTTTGTRYRYSIMLLVSKTTNTSAFLYSMGGNAVIARHSYTVTSNPASPGTTVAAADTVRNSMTAGFTSQFAITATDAGASDYSLTINGTIDITTGGTLIPQMGFTATPGTLITTAHSQMSLWPLGAVGINTSVGTWV